VRALVAGLRFTRRGIGVAVVGLLATASGIAIGVTTLVNLGLVLLLAVLAGLALLLLDLVRLQHGRLHIVRTVRPHPLTVDDLATVRVEVTGTGNARLHRMQISERAARELSDGGAPRARVARSARRLELTYPVVGTCRGRWRTGPLEVRRSDLFGAVEWRGPVGEATSIAVRPRVVPLRNPWTRAALDARAAAGTRTSAPDDAALREYRPGDDLRRVHWASSARVGALVVRQDEQSGRRPATVLLELPVEAAALEWSISTAVSLAAALLDSGHTVRMVVAGDAGPHRGPGSVALEEILDEAVDLSAAPDRVTARSWLLAGIESLAVSGAGRELVVGVLGALDQRTLADLARLGAAHEAWALVRSTGAPTAVERATVDSLRRGGWSAVAADVQMDPDVAWTTLLDLHDAAVAER